MYSFIFFTSYPVFFSATCCGLMSIVQVAFVNPLLNELCMSKTEDMRAVSDSVRFRKRLKTHLFSLAFNVC